MAGLNCLFCLIHIVCRQLQPYYHPCHIVCVSLGVCTFVYFASLVFIWSLFFLSFFHSVCKRLNFVNMYSESSVRAYKLTNFTNKQINERTNLSKPFPINQPSKHLCHSYPEYPTHSQHARNHNVTKISAFVCCCCNHPFVSLRFPLSLSLLVQF